jgi:hypothetical protein
VELICAEKEADKEESLSLRLNEETKRKIKSWKRKLYLEVAE